MKHLRRFDESSEDLTEHEIQDFCEVNLAYLLDDGLRVLVSPDYFDLKVIDYKVTLSFRLFVNKRWSQIKDQVIPFLTRLRNEYDLLEFDDVGGEDIKIDFIGLRHSDSTNPIAYPDWFNINDIISEKIVPAGRLSDAHKVSTIQFKIKGKK
jgi:hypothetical protein